MTQRNLTRHRAHWSKKRTILAILITASLIGTGSASAAPSKSAPATRAAVPLGDQRRADFWASSPLRANLNAVVSFETAAFVAAPASKAAPVSEMDAQRAAQIFDAKAAKVRAAQVKAAKIRAAKIKAAKLKAAKIKAAKVKAAKLRAAKAAKIRAAKAKAAKAAVRAKHAKATKAHRVVVHKAKVTKKAKAKKVTARASRKGRSVLAIARSKAGSSYRYGATGPNVFDCSGFVTYVYRQAGYNLPRMARAIYPAVRHVSSPRPGDIVFFINGGHATHVGIYAGGGKMYDAPRSGKTVGAHVIKYYNGTVRYGRP